MKCEHINKIQRDSITSSLSHKKKLIDIDNELDLDTASVSKEIKEIELNKDVTTKNDACKRILRFPYYSYGYQKSQSIN